MATGTAAAAAAPFGSWLSAEGGCRKEKEIFFRASCFPCVPLLLLLPLLSSSLHSAAAVGGRRGFREEDGWRAIEVGAGVEGSNNGSRISNFVLGFSSLFSWVLLVPIVVSRGAFVVVFFYIYRAQHALKGRQARHAHTGQGTRNWQLAEPPCAYSSR